MKTPISFILLQEGLDLSWVLTIDLSTIGAIASIFGLLLTGWVAFQVKKISSFYVAKVRLPTLLSDLESTTSQLSEHLNDLEQFGPAVHATLRRLEAVLKSIRSKVSGDVKSTTKQLITDVEEYFATAGDHIQESDIREIYSTAIGLHQEVTDYQRDKEWER